MKLGIIGLPQTGKKKLFEVLTGSEISSGDAAAGKSLVGVAEIKDPRFDRLVEFYKPKKIARARIDIELLPKLEKETLAKGDIFKDIAGLDALCHVVRAFEDESVYHVEGSVNPRRDIDNINSELIIHDLIFVEKRLERLAKDIIKGINPAAKKDKELLDKLKSQLDRELPLRLLELAPEEKKATSSYPLLTRKEMLVVLNVSEDSAGKNDFDSLREQLAALKIEFIQISAKVEAEIARMSSEVEKKEFLEMLGIAEPAVNVLTRRCLAALNLMSFFTVGEDEVKQWLVRRGALAPEAAGVIHSDLEKGFIRAEMFKISDLFELGSEQKLKESGKFYSKGRDYQVADGDILSFLSGV